MNEKEKTLFISYSQSDGNGYADDLEEELRDYFDVKRDKSRLSPNDDIYLFMAGIAEQDYVIIVLTPEYVKSRNCMLEMAYLANQKDWTDKTTVLVIDESIYDTERKLEIINYWNSKRKQLNIDLHSDNNANGKHIMGKDMEYLDLINSQLESFLLGISRRLNPSPITIVNEMVRKLKNGKIVDNPEISKEEKLVKDYLEKNGAKTIKEISEERACSIANASRIVRRLLDQNIIQLDGASRQGKYSVKNV